MFCSAVHIHVVISPLGDFFSLFAFQKQQKVIRFKMLHHLCPIQGADMGQTFLEKKKWYLLCYARFHPDLDKFLDGTDTIASVFSK